MSYKFTSMDNSLVLGLLGTRCQSCMFDSKSQGFTKFNKKFIHPQPGLVWFSFFPENKGSAFTDKFPPYEYFL